MKFIIMTHLFFYAILQGCANSNGTSTGNPLVAVQFKSFSAFTVQNADSTVSPMTVSNLKMCFKRLRFKPASGVAENIDLQLDEVAIVSIGQLVTTAAVPAGIYSRVEFDLDPHCLSAKSVQVTNSPNGTFTSNETMTIRFDGNLVLTASQNLDLNIQAIISALNTVTSNADIKIKAEAASGTF